MPPNAKSIAGSWSLGAGSGADDDRAERQLNEKLRQRQLYLAVRCMLDARIAREWLGVDRCLFISN